MLNIAPQSTLSNNSPNIDSSYDIANKCDDPHRKTNSMYL